MARTKRSAKLDTRSARMNLAREERHVDTIQPGRYIIYQRPKGGAAGSWLARWLNPQSKKQKQIKLGVADDYSEADGISTLTFSQAQMKAQIWFGEQDQIAHQEATGEVLDQGPFTVASALDQYFANGERLGKKGLSRDRQRANAWIYPELGEFDVATLTQKQALR